MTDVTRRWKFKNWWRNSREKGKYTMIKEFSIHLDAQAFRVDWKPARCALCLMGRSSQSFARSPLITVSRCCRKFSSNLPDLTSLTLRAREKWHGKNLKFGQDYHTTFLQSDLLLGHETWETLQGLLQV